jgi:Protein of unknown function (DUF3309)
MLGLILVIILVLFLFGSFPAWPYSRSWGYGPSGILGFLVLFVIVLMVFEVIAAPWHHPVVVARPVVVVPR